MYKVVVWQGDDIVPVYEGWNYYTAYNEWKRLTDAENVTSLYQQMYIEGRAIWVALR